MDDTIETPDLITLALEWDLERAHRDGTCGGCQWCDMEEAEDDARRERAAADECGLCGRTLCACWRVRS